MDALTTMHDYLLRSGPYDFIHRISASAVHARWNHFCNVVPIHLNILPRMLPPIVCTQTFLLFCWQTTELMNRSLSCMTDDLQKGKKSLFAIEQNKT